MTPNCQTCADEGVIYVMNDFSGVRSALEMRSGAAGQDIGTVDG